jgi:hypothetical protein
MLGTKTTPWTSYPITHKGYVHLSGFSILNKILGSWPVGIICHRFLHNVFLAASLLNGRLLSSGLPYLVGEC